MKEVVVVIGSRSGGHILPGLAKAREWHDRGARVYFIAEDRPLDRSLVERESWLAGKIFLKLSAPRIRRFWNYPWYIGQFAMMWIYSMVTLYGHKVTRVVSMGGYSSIPVCCAAFFLRIPYELYELNAELGRAVQLLRSKAEFVVCCFPEALESVNPRARKLIEYPVRFTARDIIDSVQARRTIGLHPEKYTLFILGGSQGSQGLSLLIISWLRTLSVQQKSKIQIIHQTGEHIHAVRDCYKELQVEAVLFNYSDNLASCYSAADLVITRAGSGALHEMMFFKKRALMIPLETVTTRHQVSNAQSVQKRDPALWTLIRQYDEKQIYEFLMNQIPKD